MITYAITDIHGCAAHLGALLNEIEGHHEGRPHKIVFMGDYIDRGVDSAGVISKLRALQLKNSQTVICLAGNHEELLIKSLRSEYDFLTWISNGGKYTLKSYGISYTDEIPSDDINWLSSLPTLYEDSLRYFVHAGLHPEHPVEPEDRQARLWIRDPFLTREHDFGKLVVHGHTPQESGKADIRRFRVNLDTACVFGRTLTAGVFNQKKAHPTDFLQIGWP